MHDPVPPDDLTFQPVAPLAPGQRANPYWDVERLCRGPEPVPDWLVTDRAAVDTDLGLLKTGKEADCLLLERAVPGGASCVLAAKRYRSAEHRQFQRSTGYQEGRKIRGSREARAAAKKTTFGRAVLSGQWVQREWEALTELWSAGVPCPTRSWCSATRSAWSSSPTTASPPRGWSAPDPGPRCWPTPTTSSGRR